MKERKVELLYWCVLSFYHGYNIFFPFFLVTLPIRRRQLLHYCSFKYYVFCFNPSFLHISKSPVVSALFPFVTL